MIAIDSSLLVSFYILDAHSQEASRRMAMGSSMYISSLNRAELANSIYRQVFGGKFGTADADLCWANFENDMAAGVWAFVETNGRMWERSIALAKQFSAAIGTRTLDVLHVACALELNGERFWTFDERQAKLAEAVGLDTRA